MNKKQITYLLANPQEVSSIDVRDLQTVIDTYPYFQSARALQLKGLKNENSFKYNDALKLTAAHTADRDMLFSYITSKEFSQNKISQEILQHQASFDDIEVEFEDVTQQTILELNDSLKAEMQKAEAILNPDLFEKKIASVIEILEPSEKETEAEAEAEIEKNSTIEIDAPLEFSGTDTHSFVEWLKLSNAKPIERTEEDAAKKPKKSIEEKFKLIENFIQDRPKKLIKSATTEQKDLSLPFTKTPDTLMTETLAKVYLQQKNYSKAIQAYKILILKYPEKSGFFADQIRAIEKSIKK